VTAAGAVEDALIARLDEQRAEVPKTKKRTKQRRDHGRWEEALRQAVKVHCKQEYLATWCVPHADAMAFWARGASTERVAPDDSLVGLTPGNEHASRAMDNAPMIRSLEGLAPRKASGSRAFSDRTLMLRFYDAHAPSSSVFRRLLSRSELAVISLAAGNWPDDMPIVTKSTNVADVVRREEARIKKVMQRHARQNVRRLDDSVVPRGSREKRPPTSAPK